MKPLPLSRIAQYCKGRLEGADALIDAIETDTRTLDASDGRAALFVALKGERFDGHAHVSAAAELGARAALVARIVDTSIPQVLVADTERALADLASAVQHGRDGKVIAITGSNGKTTVKTLLVAILSRMGKAYANPGNRNNEIGLPMAVIDAPDDADFAIYEMGAGKPGDIAYLTAIARPDVSLVNNIAPAHLERMGSLQGVADTKAAIYDALPVDGTAVVNADDAFADAFVARIARLPSRRVIRFGIDAGIDAGGNDFDVCASNLRFGDEGMYFTLALGSRFGDSDAEVMLPLTGRHNVGNALAAAALALACGAGLDDIVAGLRDAEPVSGRLVRHRLANGAVLIDDSYNANPGSLDAAIDTLASMSGESWLVLGDMRELGPQARELHAAAGLRARHAGITRLFTLGAMSEAAAEAFGEGARTFTTHAALAEALRNELHTSVRVLVKGSRGSAMDRIVDALMPTGEAEHAA